MIMNDNYICILMSAFAAPNKIYSCCNYFIFLFISIN